MNYQKLIVTLTMTLFILSCFIFMGSASAADTQNNPLLYAAQTDDEMTTDEGNYTFGTVSNEPEDEGTQEDVYMDTETMTDEDAGMDENSSDEAPEETE